MGIRDAIDVAGSNLKDFAKSPKKYVAERTLPAYGEALSSGQVGKAAAELKDRKTRIDEAAGYKCGGAVKTPMKKASGGAVKVPAKKSSGFNW